MRQHINHGMNVGSIFGNGQMQVVVAHRDVRVDAVARPGKRLKTSWPTGLLLTSSATAECASRERAEQARPAAGYPAASWPAVAFEPPAAAWAALVVSRAVSA